MVVLDIFLRIIRSFIRIIILETSRSSVRLFYILGSVHRDSVLIRSNEMQRYAGVYLLLFTLHVSGVYRTHHQEYIKL